MAFDAAGGSAVFFMPSGPNSRSWKTRRERLAVDLLGDEPEQVVIGIVVFVLCPRREVGRPLERHAEHLVCGPYLVGIVSRLSASSGALVKLKSPERMVSSSRIVISSPAGTPSTYFEIGSSKRSLPSCTICTIEAAVIVLVFEAARKCVLGARQGSPRRVRSFHSRRRCRPAASKGAPWRRAA